MNWKQRYQIRSFFAASMWPWPLVSMLAATLLFRLVLWFDRQTGWTLDISADAARTVASTITGSLLVFIVFIFTILLVAVQLASAALTPRIIARVFKDRITKASVCIFVFTYTYTLMLMGRLEEPVPLISGLITAYGSLVCLAVFLILIDRLGNELRPVRILTSVAAEGRAAISAMYPERIAAGDRAGEQVESALLDKAWRVIEHRGAPGVILAFDDLGLLTLAQKSDCIIELVPQVGDFITQDDPLFRIYPPIQSRQTSPTTGEVKRDGIDDRLLRQSVAFGSERTLEQDPMFAFRIIVDLASKALSPAINDPTTAVLAIDQLHRLLRHVGSRRLDNGKDRDSAGQIRLSYQTPNWEDFVHLAVTEIRQFGGSSIQVARRLRAMLENLIQTVPADRAALLKQELDLLRRSAERFFVEPEDRAMANAGDSQGVGGSHA